MARRRWRPLPSSWPNIDDAKVMFTLIKAPADGPFGKRVTKARNHQNPVQTANFASLDENQGGCDRKSPCSVLPTTIAPKPWPPILSLFHWMKPCARSPRSRVIHATVWLKSEPARLTNPESAEYQALFPATLTGVAMVNAVLCHNAIRTLVVSYEQRAAARSRKS